MTHKSVCACTPLHVFACIANVSEFISSHTILAGVSRLYVRRIQPTVIGADIFLMSTICAHPAPNQILPYLCVSVCLSPSVFVKPWFLIFCLGSVMSCRLSRRVPYHGSHLYTQPLSNRQSWVSTRWAPTHAHTDTDHLMTLFICNKVISWEKLLSVHPNFLELISGMFVIFQGKIIRDKHTTKMAEIVGDPFKFHVKDVAQTHCICKWFYTIIMFFLTTT